MTDRPDFDMRIDGEIAWLVLNRPEKRNAVTIAMWQELERCLDTIDADPGIKLVILRGADETAFAAGADIDEFSIVHATPESSAEFAELYGRAQRRLALFPKPVFAMIQGPCVGAGTGLATATDIRFADTTARFGVPAAKLGSVYRLEDTKRIVDLVGPSHAKRFLFSGGIVDAEEALRIGLIDMLFAPQDIERQIRSFAAEVCSVSQYSVRAAKRVIRAILDGAWQETEETDRLFVEAVQGQDYREGVQAFHEKRKPAFTWPQ
jgi:enoyl-CoA hydratase/carnithine racemase